jgi:hypothetical protein
VVIEKKLFRDLSAPEKQNLHLNYTRGFSMSRSILSRRHFNKLISSIEIILRSEHIRRKHKMKLKENSDEAKEMETKKERQSWGDKKSRGLQ